VCQIFGRELHLARKVGQIVGRAGGWFASSSAVTARPAGGATQPHRPRHRSMRPETLTRMLRERDLLRPIAFLLALMAAIAVLAGITGYVLARRGVLDTVWLSFL
jgi:hypothetical protein